MAKSGASTVHALSTGQAYRGDIFSALSAAALLALGVVWSRCPRWGAMWIMAIGLYGIAKVMTWRRYSAMNVPFRHAIRYLFAWPGLNAREFLNPRVAPARPRSAEWVFAAAKFLLGMALLRLAIAAVVAGNDLLAGWLGLGAIVFTLQFGIFHLLSCLWRYFGFGAFPVMDWPILATSLAEFWGRRWNRPVNDGTYQFVFGPWARTLGVRASSLLAFLFSGVIHEMLITIPAGAAWGSPTLYFLIQGTALHFERSSPGRRLRLGSGSIGWLYTTAIVVLPVGFLFPPPFMKNVIVPMLRVIDMQS